MHSLFLIKKLFLCMPLIERRLRIVCGAVELRCSVPLWRNCKPAVPAIAAMAATGLWSDGGLLQQSAQGSNAGAGAFAPGAPQRAALLWQHSQNGLVSCTPLVTKHCDSGICVSIFVL